MNTNILQDSIVPGMQIFFYVLVIVFLVHAVMLAYHWVTFGNNRKMTMTALATYLGGGAVLFLAFSISLFSL